MKSEITQPGNTRRPATGFDCQLSSPEGWRFLASTVETLSLTIACAVAVVTGTVMTLAVWVRVLWMSAVSQDDFMAAIAAGRGPADAPDGTEGIDLGFGYAPGASLATGGEKQALQDFVAQKSDTLPPEIGGDLLQSLVGIIEVALLNELLKKIAERKKAQPDETT